MNARNRAYNAAHKKQRKAYAVTYYAEHKEETNARQRVYDAAHRKERRGYYAEHKTELAAKKVSYNAAVKLEALNAYGGPRCACCGETLFEGLQIDHVVGGGAADRKTWGHGNAIYFRLKKRGWPPGYQVLCGTCNFAKGKSNHCPHQDLPRRVLPPASTGGAP